QSLFRFIAYRVLSPYELKAFPFYSRDNNREIPFNRIISPTGTPAQILTSDKIGRKPIDGTYRFRLLEFMRLNL
ncbi:MAG: hypothetical protein GTN82_31090, partial [Candidatus Aminicenantes bacterium]|nr:hypothetical protein [Candidatus Aminicenantes bacterium]